VSDAGVLRSTTVMAAGTLVSRLLGLVRTLVLLSLLGVTGSLAADTFATANTVPNNLYNLVAGGLLNAVLVPQIIASAKHSDGGRAFLDRLITIALVSMAAITVLATAAAPLVPVVFAPSSAHWDHATVTLCIAFAYWCVPQVFFYGLYTVLGQVLNARGRFGAYMWAPVLNNVVAVGGVVALLAWIGGYDPGRGLTHPPSTWTPGQIALLAGSATLGVVLQALVLLIPLRRMGFRYRPRFGLRGVGLGDAGRVAAWTFAAALIGQLSYIVSAQAVNGAGARGGPGQNSYMTAYLLFMLPHSLVTVSLVTALFTRMSRAATDHDLAGVRRDLSLGLRLTGVASLLATAGVLALAPDLTATLLFGNSPAETAAVAAATVAMIAGLAPFSAQYLFQRAYYAFADARTPFLISVPVVLTIAVTSYLSGALLDPQVVVEGIGFGMSLAYLVGVLLSVVDLRRRLGSLDGRRVVGTLGRVLAASVPTVVVGRLASVAVHALLGPGAVASLVALAVGGLLVLVVFALGCRALRVRELDELAGPLLRRLPIHH
jgi:putative peptidoglycan lipid II flippase